MEIQLLTYPFSPRRLQDPYKTKKYIIQTLFSTSYMNTGHMKKHIYNGKLIFQICIRLIWGFLIMSLKKVNSI